MAATIVTTPSLGASDWSNFITQVAGLKKGFMQLSYTNFYSTAVSAIATGSVMEVNGSFYQFTETSIDYSTTTSANADLYIYAQPSAGGTTLSIVALTAACAWVDSKQGFYASAASNNRAIGGMWVRSAATYYNKYIYNEKNVEYCLIHNQTRPLLKKILNIGEWDMLSTSYITINLDNIYGAEIIHVGGQIVDDSGTWYNWQNNSGSTGKCYTQNTSTLIRIDRVTGGECASAAWDGTASTVPNRGYIVIEYRA